MGQQPRFYTSCSPFYTMGSHKMMLCARQGTTVSVCVDPVKSDVAPCHGHERG